MHKLMLKYTTTLLIVFTIFTSFICNAEPYFTVTQGDEGIYLPIIMYHEVKYNKLGKDAISPYEFESDLKYIHNTTVVLFFTHSPHT